MGNKLVLTVQAEQDEELRGYIKGLIRAQVVSVMRETVGDIVRQEVEALIKERLGTMVQGAVDHATNLCGIGPRATDIAKKQVVERALHNWVSLNVSADVRDEIRRLAPAAVREEVKQQIKDYVVNLMNK